MSRICSRWDWEALRYDYFRCPGPYSVGGWKPLTGLGVERTRPSGRGDVGVDIDVALPELPRGCVQIGRGVQAVGDLVRPATRNPWSRPATGTAGVGGVFGRLANDQQTRNLLGAFLLGITAGFAFHRSGKLAFASAVTAAFVVGLDSGAGAQR